MWKLIFIIPISILYLLVILDRISVYSTHKRYRVIRYIFWKHKKKKLINIVSVSNPLLAYPLMIQLELSKNNIFKRAYLSGGINKLLEVYKEWGNEFLTSFTTPPKRTIQRSIEYMQQWRKERTQLSSAEEEFIDKYMEQQRIEERDGIHPKK